MCHHHEHGMKSLEDAQEDMEYIILKNIHRKSFELGLYNGNTIKIIRNNHYQRNLIIAVGESRYIISKDIARHILIKEVKAD
jgi:Fe2+ transport system protein FeoA